MNNILLYLLIITFVLYIYFTRFRNIEGFDSDYGIDKSLNDTHNYTTKVNSDSYDMFYSFLYNDIYFDDHAIDNVVKKVGDIILKYANNIYAHHLDASSKCGHLTEYLYNSIDTKCMQNNENLIKYEHYHYPKHNIINGSLYDLSSIRPNTFSHISVINYDIYDYEDIGVIMKNINYWLIDKGHLFVLVFSNFDEINNYYKQNNTILNGRLIYTSSLQKNIQNEYTLIEKLRNESINKERKNVQTKYFHSNDRISYYAEMYGMPLIENIEIISGTNLLVFKKG